MLPIMESYVNEKPYDQIPLVIFFEGYDAETKKAEGIYDFDTTEAFLEKIPLNDIKNVSIYSLIEKDRQYYWKTLTISVGEKEHYAYFRQKERNADAFDENPADKVYDDWKAFRQEHFPTFKDLYEAVRHPRALPEDKTLKDLRKEWRDLRKTTETACDYEQLRNEYANVEEYCEKVREFNSNKGWAKEKMYSISHYFMLYDTEHMKKQVSNWVKKYNSKRWKTDKWD